MCTTKQSSLMSCAARPSRITAEHALRQATQQVKAEAACGSSVERETLFDLDAATRIESSGSASTRAQLSGCPRQARLFMPCPSPRFAAAARRRIYRPRSRRQVSLARPTRASDPPHNVVVVLWDDAAMRLYGCQVEVSSCSPELRAPVLLQVN